MNKTVKIILGSSTTVQRLVIREPLAFSSTHRRVIHINTILGIGLRQLQPRLHISRALSNEINSNARLARLLIVRYVTFRF